MEQISIKSNNTSTKPIFRLPKLINFQGVNRIFVSSLEDTIDRTVHAKYFLPSVEKKDYNVMIDG